MCPFILNDPECPFTFVYFSGSPLLLRSHLETISWHPKSATDVARKAVYTTTL